MERGRERERERGGKGEEKHECTCTKMELARIEWMSVQGHLIVNDIHRLHDECGLSDDNIH